MTASYFPLFAIFFAMSGISNAPGTHATSMFSSGTSCLTSPSFAPPKSFDVINSLNLATTIPTLIPSCVIFPSITFIFCSPYVFIFTQMSLSAIINYLEFVTIQNPRTHCKNARCGVLIWEYVSHAVLLCFQIKQVMRCGAHLDWHTLADFHAKLWELVYLVRVICEKAQAVYAKLS